MFGWLADNVGTVLAVLALVIIIAAIIIKMIADRKKGKSSCGCDCGCCGMSEQCHNKH